MAIRSDRILRRLSVLAFLVGCWPRPAVSQFPGSEFQVNTYTTSNQGFPSVAADGSGNFVVIWESYEQDGSHYGVFGRRYDSSGSAVGGEFPVNSHTTSGQSGAAVAADGSGNFVVVWHSFLQDGSGTGVFRQRFDSAGSPVGREFQVNSYTTGDQWSQAVAAEGAGNFVVTWMSADAGGSGILGQRLAALLFGDTAGGSGP